MGVFAESNNAGGIALKASKTSIVIGHLRPGTNQYNMKTAMNSIVSMMDKVNAVGVSELAVGSQYLEFLVRLIDRSNGDFDKVSFISKTGSIRIKENLPNVLPISTAEAKKIADVFESGSFDEFMENGITVDGKLYYYADAADNLVFAESNNAGGIALKASKTSIVIGHLRPGTNQYNMKTAMNSIVSMMDKVNAVGVSANSEVNVGAMESTFGDNLVGYAGGLFLCAGAFFAGRYLAQKY